MLDAQSHFALPTCVIRRITLAGLVIVLAGLPVSAQTSRGLEAGTKETAEAEKSKANAKDLLDDFEHYVLIDRPDIAIAKGRELLDLNLSPQDFVRVVEQSRRGVSHFSKAVIRASSRKELEPIAAALIRAYEGGKLAQARDPQAIEKNIRDLTGQQRQRLFARERLLAAGEYAMPQLLGAYLQRADARLSAEVRQVMVELGRQAVVPLCTALSELDGSSQELVAEVLGDISYTHSVPFLYDLRAATSSPNVQAACEQAIQKIVGLVNDAASVSERYVDVANSYYAESPTLTPFPRDPNQLWWSFDSRLGLTFQAIDTRVFHEAMAMRLSERALEIDAKNQGAVSLWIAANFSREIDTPGDGDFENPAYGKDRRDATYYAVAAGSSSCQRVLSRALDDLDVPLARKAIAAAQRTAGGSGLWEGLSERKPLLEALRFANRRVQYEAAIAIGSAQPRQQFEGAERVVPILASAIRDADAKYAVVLASDAERKNSLSGIMQGQGYQVLPAATNFAEIEQPIAEAPGIDVIVTDLPASQTQQALDEARARIKLRATPILSLVSEQGRVELETKYLRDRSVRIARAGLNASEIGVASDQLLERSTGGPITADEAIGYKAHALSTLRDLGISGNTVLNIADAAGPLESAVRNVNDPTRFVVAEVLAYVPVKSAQQTLFDTAMDAAGSDRVQLLNAVAQSARRAGNLLTDRQIAALVDLVKTGEDAEATAAASLMGALNLPNANIVPLILGKKG